MQNRLSAPMQPQPPMSQRPGELCFRGVPLCDMTREQLIVAVELLYAAWEQRGEVIRRVADHGAAQTATTCRSDKALQSIV